MSETSKSKKNPSDAELLKLAEQEILGEAKRAAVRYSVVGPSGWRPCQLPKANKVFLVNTIKNTVAHNRIKERPSKTKKKLKERKMFQGRKSGGNCVDNFIFKPPKKEKTDLNKKNPQIIESRKSKSPSIKSDSSNV